MGFHDFPRFLGKSDVYLYHPPSYVHAYLPASTALDALRSNHCWCLEIGVRGEEVLTHYCSLLSAHHHYRRIHFEGSLLTPRKSLLPS